MSTRDERISLPEAKALLGPHVIDIDEVLDVFPRVYTPEHRRLLEGVTFNKRLLTSAWKTSNILIPGLPWLSLRNLYDAHPQRFERDPLLAQCRQEHSELSLRHSMVLASVEPKWYFIQAKFDEDTHLRTEPRDEDGWYSVPAVVLIYAGQLAHALRPAGEFFDPAVGWVAKWYDPDYRPVVTCEHSRWAIHIYRSNQLLRKGDWLPLHGNPSKD